ncbi:hypothetical protein ADK38_39935 [Streptomyces varsoviensis]|uniref:Lipoprotein n=1 Tax=Streptomyces varsoviensis TaxID=67373 RepID=A0ABR5IUN7_9ACTN|nr:hypothetical protein ADK38_39935 [Streptomyces varsoviensis]
MASLAAAVLSVSLTACADSDEKTKEAVEPAESSSHSPEAGAKAQDKKPPKPKRVADPEKIIASMKAFDKETCSMDQGTACDEAPGEVAALGQPAAYDPRKYTKSFTFEGGVLKVATSLPSGATKANMEMADIAGFHYGSAYEWSALMPEEHRKNIKAVKAVEIVLDNGLTGDRCEGGDEGAVPRCRKIPNAFK